MGFFDDIFKGDKKKKEWSGNKLGGGGGNDGGDKKKNNPFANLGAGRPRTFHGEGQSLGGSQPGTVYSVTLPYPGPLGVRVERRPNSMGTAIVNEVVPGTQAEQAGLKRGDIICIAGTDGQEEMMYDMFIEIARSDARPIQLDIRRLETKVNNPNTQGAKSAEADLRRQAVIAAAEKREKAHQAKTKPVKRVTKTTQARLDGANATNASTNEPLSEESRQAAAMAKQSEAALAAELGYNPYETAKSTAGQARNATATTQHGSIQADAAGNHLPTVAPPREATVAANDVDDKPMNMDLPPEFEDAYTTLVSSNDDVEAVKNSAGIMKKLIVNATTKGQTPGEDAAKFRKVRLENPKIKAAIVDVAGAVELLLSTGFSLQEQDGESVLIYPADCPGPDWLAYALQGLEKTNFLTSNV